LHSISAASACAGRATTRASSAGGPGSDQLNTPASHAPSYDVSAGTAINDGVTRFLFAGFETYTLAQGTGSLSFLGTDEPETLYLLENAATVDTAGGDDAVIVRAPRPGIIWPSLDLGAGVDRLFMGGGELQDGAFDLASGELVNSGQPHSALGVEDLFTSNWQSFSVLGTDGPDRIQLEWVCEPSVDARGGDDVVMVDARYEGCPHVIHGGDGDDVLTGGPLADQLYGDGGTDAAYGRGGPDICVAEVVDCPS
jgi:Ca2+-binding RTX toxin-like protein